MDVNIYKTYNFDFDGNSYVRVFTSALCESDIKTPSQFNQLLKDSGIENYSYETVKSYFYGRRFPPLDILIAVCKKLELSADKIVFPQSIQEPAYNNDICFCDRLIEYVFYPCNLLIDGEDFTAFYNDFSAEEYKSCVDETALVFSKYNYLIQKFRYAHVSNDEYGQIYTFTDRYIIDRKTPVESNADETLDWIRKCDNEDFINAFYSKYTFGYYKNSCRSLLELLSKVIGAEAVNYAATLLPCRDRFEVKS